MKKHLIIFTVLFATIAYGQQGRVGINTTEPKATLDVTASATDLTRTDGFIAPRLKGDELKAKDSNYTNDQTGAIVYATEAANPTTTKTVNVTSAGYYYFDGDVWVKFPAKYVEPWNVAGTNNPATSNTQDIYQNGHIGIRDNNPLSAIHILNDNISGNDDDIRVESYGLEYNVYTMNPQLFLIMSRGSKQSPENLHYRDVMGGISFNARADDQFVEESVIRSRYKGNGTTNLSSLEFTISKSDPDLPNMILDENGNLGINTPNPVSKLQVVGLQEFADNATAIAGGLTVGAFYRTGDVLKVVH